MSSDRAEDAALAIIESALAVGAEIESMTEAAPTLGQVRSATEGLWAALRKRPATAPPRAPAEDAAEPAPVEEHASPPAPAPEASAPAASEEQRGGP